MRRYRWLVSAFIRNPGLGGWAYVPRCSKRVAEGGGRIPDETTNNWMEIQAASRHEDLSRALQ